MAIEPHNVVNCIYAHVFIALAVQLVVADM